MGRRLGHGSTKRAVATAGGRGRLGMILCVPIMVILMIICGHFGPTRPLAILLSSDGEIDWHTDARTAP